MSDETVPRQCGVCLSETSRVNSCRIMKWRPAGRWRHGWDLMASVYSSLMPRPRWEDMVLRRFRNLSHFLTHDWDFPSICMHRLLYWGARRGAIKYVFYAVSLLTPAWLSHRVGESAAWLNPNWEEEGPVWHFDPCYPQYLSELAPHPLFILYRSTDRPHTDRSITMKMCAVWAQFHIRYISQFRYIVCRVRVGLPALLVRDVGFL